MKEEVHRWKRTHFSFAHRFEDLHGCGRLEPVDNLIESSRVQRHSVFDHRCNGIDGGEIQDAFAIRTKMVILLGAGREELTRGTW